MKDTHTRTGPVQTCHQCRSTDLSTSVDKDGEYQYCSWCGTRYQFPYEPPDVTPLHLVKVNTPFDGEEQILDALHSANEVIRELREKPIIQMVYPPDYRLARQFMELTVEMNLKTSAMIVTGKSPHTTKEAEAHYRRLGEILHERKQVLAQWEAVAKPDTEAIPE